jgi:hypothetical protein
MRRRKQWVTAKDDLKIECTFEAMVYEFISVSMQEAYMVQYPEQTRLLQKRLLQKRLLQKRLLQKRLLQKRLLQNRPFGAFTNHT